jgi:hypothetical protein
VPADFGLADYANCLAALIEALALGPAHVAGLSWGGTVVQELYRHHPGLVATLILVDTYAGWKGSLPEDEVRARVAGARQMLAAPAEEFDPTLPGLFAGDPPAEFVPLLAEMAAAVRPESFARELSLMTETDLRDLLPRIAVPTLLIWGELDARSPLVEGWFHWHAGVAVMRDNTMTSGTGWILASDSGGMIACRAGGANLVSSTAVASLRDGWHHLALTRDRDDVRLYLDGRRLAIPATSPGSASSAAPWHVMRNGTSASQYTRGRADEVAVDDRPLTAADVRQRVALGPAA